SGAKEDRALIRLHDVGIQINHTEAGTPNFRIFVGGGMGRTPVIGKELRNDIAPHQLLPYLQSVLRIYNLYGRRDHKYKSRIKILVNDLGLQQFKEKVEKEFCLIKDIELSETLALVEKLKGHFPPPGEEDAQIQPKEIAVQHPDFTLWVKNNVLPHKNSDLRNVMVSLKNIDTAPGNMTSSQMRIIASLSDRFSRGEIRVHHEQNLLLPSVSSNLLYDLWQGLKTADLSRPNVGQITDMICCPGMDYCSLANAETIPLARELNQQLAAINPQQQAATIKLKVSGCMNACGHHHVGDIGILGVDKKGEQWYQITLGGRGGIDAQLGTRMGPAVRRADIIQVLITLVETYHALSFEKETFAQTVERTGIEPFRERIYEKDRSTKHVA
nr:nitrite/sulfite reductase [Gammaproteobacteria bacterium]